MKKYIIAVSGGVDSVVLLDMASKWNDAELIVAHFDHGIRDDSSADARFVEWLAKQYGLLFESQRGELGKNASEDTARQARYIFLRGIAKKHTAQLVTAHHSNDIIETIVINLLRGTGWRGLCSLRSEAIYRPLLDVKKTELVEYALVHRLEWCEDSTNQSLQYLRNYVRRQVTPKLGDAATQHLFSLYKEQRRLLSDITHETTALLSTWSKASNEYPRQLFIMSDQTTAMELLYAAILSASGRSTPRPQLARALLSVKTFKVGTTYQVGQGVELRFSRVNIIVEALWNW